MGTGFPNRDAAAELFVQMLTIVAYDGAANDVTSLLENGPPGRGPSQDRVALRQWFQSLDKDSKAYLAQVIRETADAAVFHALVLLDGMTGG